MRLRDCLLPFWSLLTLAVILSGRPSWAAGTVVRDGDTIQLGEITYRLDGIDAPVVYSGLAQGFVGLYQVNMVVPSGLTHHLAPIVVRAGGFSSQSGLIISVIPQ